MIGQVGTFSGLAGAVFQDAQTGLQIWVKSINAQGGLAGHPVQLYSYDDQANASHTTSITQDLIQNRHAQAIVGATVPLTVDGLSAVITPAKIPVVGGDVSSDTWFTNPWFFVSKSHPFFGQDALVQYMVQTEHKVKLALIYCVEANGCTEVKKYLDDDGGARKAGATIVYEAQRSVGTADFTADCLQARNAGAEMVFVAMDGASDGRVANSCSQQGFKPTYLTGGAGVSPDQANNPNLDGMTVSDPSVLWTQNTTPAEQQYQRAVASYASDKGSSAAMVSGWAAGKLLEAAVAKLGARATEGPLTSSLISQGLWEIRDETLGGLLPGAVTFDQGKPSTALPCTYIGRIQSGKWVAPIGDQQVCLPH